MHLPEKLNLHGFPTNMLYINIVLNDGFSSGEVASLGYIVPRLAPRLDEVPALNHVTSSSQTIQMGMDQYLLYTIFRGMNIHKSQLFWCELQGYKVLTHCQISNDQHILFSRSYSADLCSIASFKYRLLCLASHNTRRLNPFNPP